MIQEELENLAQTSAQSYWADAANYGLDRGLGLSRDSVTVDVGGYLGAWTAYLVSRYDCAAHVYEPVQEFYLALRIRFKDNPRVWVNGFGLEGQNRHAAIANMGDASSMFYPLREDAEEVRICDAHAALRDLDRIDLMMVNGEGCEYSLLPRLVDSELIRRIGRILVQFHTFYPDAEKERERVRRLLSITHREEWSYPFCWESWVRL